MRTYKIRVPAGREKINLSLIAEMHCAAWDLNFAPRLRHVLRFSVIPSSAVDLNCVNLFASCRFCINGAKRQNLFASSLRWRNLDPLQRSGFD